MHDRTLRGSGGHLDAKLPKRTMLATVRIVRECEILKIGFGKSLRTTKRKDAIYTPINVVLQFIEQFLRTFVLDDDAVLHLAFQQLDILGGADRVNLGFPQCPTVQHHLKPRLGIPADLIRLPIDNSRVVQQALEQQVELDHNSYVIKTHPELFLSLAILPAKDFRPQSRNF